MEIPSMNPVKNIRIMCPNLKCRSILVVPETARGKNVKCSNCTTLFKIPSQAPQPAAVAGAKH
jgi:LSD1 subclass zinc finger protein